MTAGTLTVVGPVAATELQCTLGLRCETTLTGADLSATNGVGAAERCGDPPLARMLTADGVTFEWTPLHVEHGDYEVCWDVSGDARVFDVPITIVSVAGPRRDGGARGRAGGRLPRAAHSAGADRRDSPRHVRASAAIHNKTVR